MYITYVKVFIKIKVGDFSWEIFFQIQFCDQKTITLSKKNL